MSIFKKSIGIIVAATVLVSCQLSKSKLSEQITLLENETSEAYDVVKLEKLSSLYREYINKFPQDSLVIEYLFRSGTLNMTLRNGGEALSNFTTLINRFPQNPYLAEAYYYKAYVYEDILYEIEEARIAYYEFINRFSEHQLVKDATLSVQYLGKSPEEIVLDFEEKE